MEFNFIKGFNANGSGNWEDDMLELIAIFGSNV